MTIDPGALGKYVAEGTPLGIVFWIILRYLQDIQHSLKSLSKGMWMDLASRPYSDARIKEIAHEELDRMEKREKKRGRS